MDMLTPLGPSQFEAPAELLIEASPPNTTAREFELLPGSRDRGIHQLPVELLVEVFRCALDCRAYDESSIQTVQNISHVCAHWRQVAITTPHLWTEVLPIKLNKTPTEACCSGLKEWLRRSAPLPVRVHLECAGGVDAAVVFGALLTASPRWSGAYFRLPSLSVLTAIPSDALKQLRVLAVYSQDTANSPALVAFSLAPALGEVILDTHHPARLLMPWSQLAHLHVTTESPNECLASFLQCPNLVTATLEMPSWPVLPDLSQSNPTTLGKLQVLKVSITDADWPSVTPFIVCLALPALKRLILWYIDLEWSSAEFAQFQLLSPNIESLRLGYSELESDDLMTILRHTPMLSELKLVGCPYAFDDSIVSALSSVHLPLVPRLHTLNVTQGCNSHFDDDMLNALISSRWWTDEESATFMPPPVSRWSCVSIDRDEVNDISREFAAKLKEYVRQGLSVEVGNSTYANVSAFAHYGSSQIL
ncbi:hypothetical protein C8R46DRAFT_1352782 [Mycena filopes]|nr:hypothetical protein C8R46DRAFT_1352782 [Mycena filopes]